MNKLESVIPSGVIEHELNEHTFLALVKYARCLARFHYLGVVAEMERAPSDSTLDQEAAA